MKIPYLLSSLILVLSVQNVFSQIIAGSFDPEVDTSYVDLQYDNWSLRLLGTYKHQDILLSNDAGKTVRYVPNDRTSAGIGFSYKYMIVDIGVRLLFNREEFTSRFDLQGEIAVQKHLLDVIIQRYKGFNKINAQDEVTFRDDMRSWVIGMNYLHNFNHKKISIRSVITGNRQPKKAAHTALLGGFFSIQDLEADSSIIHSGDGDYNQFAQMHGSRLNNVGILGGYAFITPIVRNVFLLAGVMPGLGLNYGEVEAIDAYRLRLKPMAKVNTRAALGYIGSRWYGGVHYSSDYYLINLEHNNLYRYNIGKLKLVLGYKFSAENTIVERILGK